MQTKTIDRGDVRIELAIHGREMGNEHDYFSVTCTGPGFGGSAHEQIAELAPEVRPLIELHLADAETGEPMHARANGWYLYSGDSRRYELEQIAKGGGYGAPYEKSTPADDRIRAARALHIEPDELPEGMTRDEFERFCDGLAVAWKDRARAGREFLESIEGVPEGVPRPGSVAAFADRHGVTVAEAEWIKHGDHDADVWNVELERAGERVTITGYSKGSAFMGEEPTAAEVLEALKLDAELFERTEGDAAELAGALGYDELEDAKRLAEVAAGLEEESEQLTELLGEELRGELLEIVE